MTDAERGYPVLFRQEQRLRALDPGGVGSLRPSTDASVVAIQLRGKVDVQRLLIACRHALTCGPALSVRFERASDGYVQKLVENPPIAECHDEGYLDQLRAGKIAPFWLDSEATLRVTLSPATANSTAFVAELDHAAVDEWAMRLFLDRITRRYVVLENTPELRIPDLDRTYFSIVEEQRVAFGPGQRALIDRLAWWADHIVPETILPPMTGFCRALKDDSTPIDHIVSYSVQTEVSTQLLRSLARQLPATLFEIVCVSVLETLAESIGSSRVGLITAVANRSGRRQQRAIGLLAEPQPVVLDLARADTIGELIAQVRASLAPKNFVPFPLLLREFAPAYVGRPFLVPRIDLKVVTKDADFKLSLPGVESTELPVNDGGYPTSWMLTVDCSAESVVLHSIFDASTFIRSEVSAFLYKLAHAFSLEMR